ncbi:dipeptide/oligopeptide/nickel ABC transporter permease/ATP-binding protein [Subtercola lobariae]|uniref:Dipeptide/oligopeptide/nickel ABC transporter ATP-binding protein n=1 Tax=Subtercola lobariae TaxID=1588641 RepID=A0A917B3A4_9MICO|nr:dipeptide/oligopeptide/nickel ABC transporter permease/ATP-binding protein [Subtercola lobariae]GGF15656.1 dipeptide/oligopeptide/nickel ABC transporter ATP-binding protein [Subtercola lobariae]
MTTRRGTVFRTLITNPVSILALIWLAIVIIGMLIVIPLISRYSPTEQDLAATLQLPSAAHLLGTDSLGRDILARLAWGSRVTITGVVIVAVIANVIGATMGLIAGHFRSGLDATFTAFADMLQSIPALVVLLSVAAVTSRNVTVVMVVLGVLMSAGAYRVFRASTLNIRGELFITAARTSGLREGQIMVRHELPRLLGQLVIQSSIIASLAIVVQVGLGFLGIDAAPPNPSWGGMIKEASTSIYTNIWPLIPTSAVVVLTILAFSTLGDVAQRAVLGRRRHNGLSRAKISRSVAKTAARASGATVSATQVASTAASAGAAAGAINPMLVISDLTVSVPKDGSSVKLVSNVSLTLLPGEVVGLVGESGAGKSVTARAALGILPAGATATGSVVLDGQEVLGASEQTLQKLRGSKIAYIAQEPMAALNPAYRVGNQLIEIVRTHQKLSRKAARQRAIQLLETVQIKNTEHVLKAYPHQISGGMAQRIVIAIALSGDPDVIVADEPTTALDVSAQMQILDLLRTLQKERDLAVLLVTHDWGVVADLCDRGIAMYAGEIVEEAEVAPLFAHPRHPYSMALRASDPHAQKRGGRLHSIPGVVPPPGTWPSGCRFADRCGFATDACREQAVPLELIEDRHAVRCIRVDEIVVEIEELRHESVTGERTAVRAEAVEHDALERVTREQAAADSAAVESAAVERVTIERVSVD